MKKHYNCISIQNSIWQQTKFCRHNKLFNNYLIHDHWVYKIHYILYNFFLIFCEILSTVRTFTKSNGEINCHQRESNQKKNTECPLGIHFPYTLLDACSVYIVYIWIFLLSLYMLWKSAGVLSAVQGNSCNFPQDYALFVKNYMVALKSNLMIYVGLQQSVGMLI